MKSLLFTHLRPLLALSTVLVAGCAYYEAQESEDLITNREVCEYLYYECKVSVSLETCSLNVLVVSQECLRSILETPCDIVDDPDNFPHMDICYPRCSEESISCEGDQLRVCQNHWDGLREEIRDCNKKCEPSAGTCQEVHGMNRCVCE